MKILDTEHISCFPHGVLMGTADIAEELQIDILNPSEREEWQGFKNGSRRDEFLAGRHLFRFLLQIGDLDSDYSLHKYELGKPYAIAADKILNVSFTHTKSTVLSAVSENLDIGIDAELATRKVNEKLLRRRILNERERKKFAEEDIIKLWTIKEAAAKCHGTGLRTNFNEFNLEKDADGRFQVTLNDEIPFQICTFLYSSYQIAIAYQKSNMK